MEIVECDYCDCTEGIRQIGDAKVCPSCIPAHNEVEANRRKENPPIDINEVLRHSRTIDAAVKVRTDLFNAATTAIVELKTAIDSDESITNKPYALATELSNRLNHWKQVIFELNEKVINAGNEQRAIQQYLNSLSNQLRAEEREKLKLQDIQYKPGPVKSVTPKPIKTAKPRLDKKELRKYANELGVAEFTLQMIVVSKGLTVQAAAELIKKSIEAAKLTSSTEIK